MKKSGYAPPSNSDDSDSMVEEDSDEGQKTVTPPSPPLTDLQENSQENEIQILTQKMPNQHSCESTDEEMSPVISRKKSVVKSKKPETDSEEEDLRLEEPKPKRSKVVQKSSATNSPVSMKFPFGAVAKDLGTKISPKRKTLQGQCFCI